MWYAYFLVVTCPTVFHYFFYMFFFLQIKLKYLNIFDGAVICPVARGKGRLRKTIGETVKKDEEVNGLTIIQDIPLWRRVIHVADPT